jgi:hypothetical protein
MAKSRKPLSAEHKAKISSARLGKKHSADTKAKISASKIGKKRSADMIAKMCARRQSEEVKEKLRKLNLGKPRPDYLGNKNPFWKGGITAANWGLNKALRSTFEYRQWRSDVYTRDNFTCQDCGDNKGGNLEAHHKKGFQQIINEHKITTVEQALACEELWNINNGVTLCKDCHKRYK